MSENKEYWNKPVEQGCVRIADDVIASIAALAAKDVDGVYSLASGISTDIAEFFGKKAIAKGVKTHLTENSVEIDVYITVKYGFPVCDVAKEIQAKAASAVEDMAGMPVTAVNVNICGIAFPEEQVAVAETSEAN